MCLSLLKKNQSPRSKPSAFLSTVVASLWNHLPASSWLFKVMNYFDLCVFSSADGQVREGEQLQQAAGGWDEGAGGQEGERRSLGGPDHRNHPVVRRTNAANATQSECSRFSQGCEDNLELLWVLSYRFQSQLTPASCWLPSVGGAGRLHMPHMLDMW